jgi:hypothetical protein
MPPLPGTPAERAAAGANVVAPAGRGVPGRLDGMSERTDQLRVVEPPAALAGRSGVQA